MGGVFLVGSLRGSAAASTAAALAAAASATTTTAAAEAGSVVVEEPQGPLWEAGLGVAVLNSGLCGKVVVLHFRLAGGLAGSLAFWPNS